MPPLLADITEVVGLGPLGRGIKGMIPFLMAVMDSFKAFDSLTQSPPESSELAMGLGVQLGAF